MDNIGLFASLLMVGLIIGAFSGMVGIGGGVLVIPVLMIGYGFSQAKANGTSLAMLLPPIGLFAVLEYSRQHNVNWRFAILLAIGFAAGAFIGARLVSLGVVKPSVLRTLFVALLLYIACRILFRSDPLASLAIRTISFYILFAASFLLARLIGKRIERATFLTHLQNHPAQQGADFDFEI